MMGDLCTGFHTANRGNPYSPYDALTLFALKNAICTIFGALLAGSIGTQGKVARLGSYSSINNRCNR
jgi:hypothetical protein